VGAYQFVYDVTERLQNEARLRSTEEALHHAQKLESLGQLTGGVAHDFNNLLAVFANGIQVLGRDVTPERRARTLDAMRRAVTRGSGLTHSLLTFSRRNTVHPVAVDIRTLLKDMREMLHASLRGDIEIDMQLCRQIWEVELDPGEFELAILNLCVNARDAMSAGGTIRVTANNGQLTLNGHTSEGVRMTVTDSGCGMSPEVQSRVFEPFFTTKDVGKGSGLGLPQVYGFIQQSGGLIEIDSKVGVGTTITLLFPRSSGRLLDEYNELAAASPRTSGMRGEVLLVEDDNEVAALTREMLSCIGFSVVHAASPGAALGALADGRSMDFVLSDIMMPGGMNGVELAREIRRRKPNLQIILTTGYPEAGASITNGEFALLRKPYTLESLADAMGFKL
jgi:nitrogen-specific signal transduction histidine kinase